MNPPNVMLRGLSTITTYIGFVLKYQKVCERLVSWYYMLHTAFYTLNVSHMSTYSEHAMRCVYCWCKSSDASCTVCYTIAYHT